MTTLYPAAAPTAPENLDAVIGENIHRLMWSAQDNQRKMAPLWGMSQAALSLKLRGKRPWFASEIDAAARHYRVTRDSLFKRLPDLDSNQEPIDFTLAPETQGTDELTAHRRAKEAAHHAVARVHGPGAEIC